MPIRILVQPDFRLRLDWGNLDSVDVEICPDSVVLAKLIILKLSGDSRCRTLILWPDSAEVDELRLLRVWLRWIWPQTQRPGPNKNKV